MLKTVVISMLVFSAAIVAGQRTVGNMCEDFGTNGELCEYDYDASADRLTIHGRIDITGSGFAQSCSDTYDNDADGNVDDADSDCICSTSVDERNFCIGFGGDNFTSVNTDGYYCDNMNGNVCCGISEYWDGSTCVSTDPCYTQFCNEGNYTPDWYGNYNNACVQANSDPTQACAFVGTQYGQLWYSYVNIYPY